VGVRERAVFTDNQHPRGIARGRRPERNALLGQFEVKERNIHA
jgi:hypothetical protein